MLLCTGEISPEVVCPHVEFLSTGETLNCCSVSRGESENDPIFEIHPTDSPAVTRHKQAPGQPGTDGLGTSRPATQL